MSAVIRRLDDGRGKLLTRVVVEFVRFSGLIRKVYWMKEDVEVHH